MTSSSSPASPSACTSSAAAGSRASWRRSPPECPLKLGAGAFLAHRVVWSLVFLVVLLAATTGFRWVGGLGRRRVGLLVVASGSITVNWGLFIYAVNSGQVVETSLGYFINPLVTVLLAVTVLRERLRRRQVVAVGIAAAGVVVLTAVWVALGVFMVDAVRAMRAGAPALPAPPASEGGALTPVLARR